MGGFLLLYLFDVNFEDEKIVIYYFFKYLYEERNYKLMISCWLVCSVYVIKKFYIFRRFFMYFFKLVNVCLNY